MLEPLPRYAILEHAEVVPHGPREEVDVLEYQTDPSSPLLLLVLPDIDAIEQYRALVNLIETWHQ